MEENNWINEWPSNWELVRFKSAYRFSRGLDIKKQDLGDHGMPVISYGQIHAKDNPGVQVLPAHVRLIPDEFVKPGQVERAHLSEGDIVFADTSEDIEGSGNMVRVSASDDLFAGYHTLIARPTEEFRHEYMAYQMISPSWRRQIQRAVQGVKVYSITQGIFNEITLLKPPIIEQQAIVDFLSVRTAEIDGLVEKLQREVQLLERYRRELIAHTVTRGLNPDVPMKDTGIEWVGEIPDSWKTVSLSAITDENRRKNADLTEKNLLSLSYGEIIRKDIDLPFGLLPASFDGYQVVDSGYIILRMTDLQNDKRSLRTGLAHERGIITGAYIGLIPRGAVISGYLAWLLRFYDLAKVFYSLGGGVRQSANYKEVGKLSVLLPPIEEQQQIAEYLDQKNAEIDSTIAGIRKQIELLGRYRKQVINDAVTGKARVGEVA
ncbi:MAG: restriction endonuclease subunit S [Acidobacteriota bacterium]|nr:restriction endonuclease subunit S [Acidobacteriota bacterium]